MSPRVRRGGGPKGNIGKGKQPSAPKAKGTGSGSLKSNLTPPTKGTYGKKNY